MGAQFDPSPMLFFKKKSSVERVNPCFFVASNGIISHIFPENLIKLPQVFPEIGRFSPSILTIFVSFLEFVTFP